MAKLVKENPDSDAGVVVSDTVVRVTVKEDNGIMVDERGTTISGPISLVNGTNQIRVGALWSFNHPMQLTLPSTIATPSPTLMIDPPVLPIASLMKDTIVMVGLIGGMTAIAAA